MEKKEYKGKDVKEVGDGLLEENFAFCPQKGLKDTKCLEGSLIVLGILGMGAEE